MTKVGIVIFANKVNALKYLREDFRVLPKGDLARLLTEETPGECNIIEISDTERLLETNSAGGLIKIDCCYTSFKEKIQSVESNNTGILDFYECLINAGYICHNPSWYIYIMPDNFTDKKVIIVDKKVIKNIKRSNTLRHFA